MASMPKAAPSEILEELVLRGFLLITDAKLPSVATRIAGGPVRGSWWGHPVAHRIFAVTEYLADHPDVLTVRLLSSKLTYVHRKLWTDLLPVATAEEPWQTVGLSAAARSTWKAVRVAGRLRSDELDLPAKTGPIVREIEGRLLVNTCEAHTESGAHRKVLETWEHWGTRTGWSGTPRAAADARRNFDRAVAELNEECGARARLPWI